MGAVSFSLDFRLVDALRTVIPLNVMVETGTFQGDTVAESISRFDKIISLELSVELCEAAADRFKDYAHVRIVQGNSADRLGEIHNELRGASILYWLDAHWCVATGTAGAESQCPLLGELDAIGSLDEQSVILIDDARLFLAPPPHPHEISQWPSFHQIIKRLISISTGHEIMVINDVIALFPKRAKVAMDGYAQSCGVDWLMAANSLKENNNLTQILRERDLALKEKDEAILEKESVINEQSVALAAYGSILAVPLVGPLLRATHRISQRFRPKIGRLWQHPPREIDVRELSVEVPFPVPTPRISIVTPSYQQGEFIERTIQSVLSQNYPNLQYFVQDGGSSDSTVEVLERYETKISGWTSRKDSGQSEAINNGLARTDGEIMAWLNSDDLLLPGALAVVANYFDRHPDVSVVYGDRLLIDEHDMQIGRWILPGHDSAVLSWADYIPQETLFWRRSLWEEVGSGVDETFQFAMDWDLLVRFRDAGAKFGRIPRFLGAFRVHGRQKTSSSINEVGHAEMARIRERVLGRVPTRDECRRAVLPYLARHVVVDLIHGAKRRAGLKV